MTKRWLAYFSRSTILCSIQHQEYRERIPYLNYREAV